MFALLLVVLHVSDEPIATPGDVARAFLELPAVHRGGARSPERNAALKQANIDTKNGYLVFDLGPERREDRIELAVFRRKNGAYLVGLVEGTGFFPPQDHLSFHAIRDGAWVDVTAEVMPARPTEGLVDGSGCSACEHGFTWALPQKGTTLVLTRVFLRNHDLYDDVRVRFVFEREKGVFTRAR